MKSPAGATGRRTGEAPALAADSAPRRAKSPDAFRTISEVGEEIDVPAHVLRFWETKFPQLAPMKRGGGRRYYRPADVALLKGVRRLLYEEGLTIKGLQKLLREKGPRHVAAIGERLEDPTPEPAASEPVASKPAASAPPPVSPGAAAAEEGLARVVSRLEALRDRLRSA